MEELNSRLVKQMVKDLGADIVGIASADRFEGAPPGHGPSDLLPGAKSVIVAGIRIPDTVAESDHYHENMPDLPPEKAVGAMMNDYYMVMGHYVHDFLLNSLAIKLANRFETEWRVRTLPTINTTHTGLGHTVMASLMGFFSQRHAATRAGLGEFGFNGLLLTPEFGPRQRLVSIITRAELEPDPLITEKICLREKCGGKDGPICLQRCLGGALQLRDGFDTNQVFIDIPSRNDLSKCIDRTEGGHGFGCAFVGDCLRSCPLGMTYTRV